MRLTNHYRAQKGPTTMQGYPTTLSPNGIVRPALSPTQQELPPNTPHGQRSFTIALRITRWGNLGFTTVIPTVYKPVALTSGYDVLDETFDTYQEARDWELALWHVEDPEYWQA